MSRSERKCERDGLCVLWSRKDELAEIRWQGTSDAREPREFLGPLVCELAETLQGLRVILDFTDAEYMNSATLSPMLELIKELDAVNRDVLVRFSDAEWQQTFLRCVRSFATTLSHVRVEAVAD